MQLAPTSNNGTRNSPGGKPTKTQVPSFRVMPTPCLKALSEGAVTNTPCATIGDLSDGLNQITLSRIHHRIGTQFARMGQFAVVDIHCADAQPHGLGILHCQVTKAAYSRNHNPLSRLDIGLLDTFVRCDARTNNRRRFKRIKACRDVSDVIGVGQDVFGKPAILRIATKLSAGADGFQGIEAGLAMTTRRLQP